MEQARRGGLLQDAADAPLEFSWPSSRESAFQSLLPPASASEPEIARLERSSGSKWRAMFDAEEAKSGGYRESGLERCSSSKWRCHLSDQIQLGLSTKTMITCSTTASTPCASATPKVFTAKVISREQSTLDLDLESVASTASGEFSRCTTSESEGEPASRPSNWTHSKWRAHLTGVSDVAEGSSTFTERSQTFLCLDWDDTLFPSTDIFHRRGVSTHRDDAVEPLLLAELAPWRAALKETLLAAKAQSEHVVILTNSARPWVSECVARFAPELEPLFARGSGLSVVYAQEALETTTRSSSSSCGSCVAGLAAWLRHVFSEDDDDAEDREKRHERMTLAKTTALAQQVSLFYGARRAWKNVISIGDDCHERNALLKLASQQPCGEHRGKALTVAPEQSVQDLTLTLKLLTALLPTLVQHNGSLDCGMPIERPMAEIGDVFGMPALALFNLSCDRDAEADVSFLSDVVVALRHVGKLQA